MKVTKRQFLKITGLSLLGIGAKPAADALSSGAQSETRAFAGKKYALVVFPKKCPQGCKDCTLNCHYVHNVPDIGDPKHEIKWIWREPYPNAFPSQQHELIQRALKDSQVPVLCNHCENPPCVRVCPTQATWKREEDGIVMMDLHRCIGCRFCMAACPFGARSFNWMEPRPHIKRLNPEFPPRMKGVAEKCNFCAERIARQEQKGLPPLPACVEACPEKALVFGDLNDPRSEVRKILMKRYSIRRKPELGTRPQVYYIV